MDQVQLSNDDHDNIHTEITGKQLNAQLPRGQKWFKCLNDTWTHNGLKYHLGENIDPIPFNPTRSCSAGGLYFSSRKNIFQYIFYGNNIAELTIPNDARVYVEHDKFKTDKFIIESVTPLKEYHGWFNEEFCNEMMDGDIDYFELVKDQTLNLCNTKLGNCVN